MTLVPATFYWDTLRHNTWTFHLAATDSGICCITLPNETFDTLQQWVIKREPSAEMVQDRVRLGRYSEQIDEYLSGRRKDFSVPLDLRGTPFQVDVWRALLEIPYGETRSYSQIGKRIGKPSAVRAIGAANGANPIPIIIPCHRVIGKSGNLTGYRGGMDMKENLLLLERM